MFALGCLVGTAASGVYFAYRTGERLTDFERDMAILRGRLQELETLGRGQLGFQRKVQETLRQLEQVDGDDDG